MQDPTTEVTVTLSIKQAVNLINLAMVGLKKVVDEISVEDYKQRAAISTIAADSIDALSSQLTPPDKPEDEDGNNDSGSA